MKVFISYSSKDKIFAEKLSRDLLKLDLDVWLDKWEIKVGDEYSNAIVHAFQGFRAPFSGKIVHIFPEQSAAFN